MQVHVGKGQAADGVFVAGKEASQEAVGCHAVAQRKLVEVRDRRFWKEISDVAPVALESASAALVAWQL